MTLEGALRAKRDAGRKLLVPYVTGMLGPGWLDLVRAVADAGADAIEIGIPFSDPVMDGPTIQEASQRALAAGATPPGIFSALRGADIGVPLVAMTYYNLVFRSGHTRFASSLADAGIAAAIVPDLCLEESEEWEADAAAAGIETIQLAAPVTPDDRLVRLCERARGFVYAVSTMGVTGERASLAASAGVLAKRIKACTDKPVLIGFGISSPQHALDATEEADGVIVASALMRGILDGGSIEDAAAFIASLRTALDNP